MGSRLRLGTLEGMLGVVEWVAVMCGGAAQREAVGARRALIGASALGGPAR